MDKREVGKNNICTTRTGSGAVVIDPWARILGDAKTRRAKMAMAMTITITRFADKMMRILGAIFARRRTVGILSWKLTPATPWSSPWSN